MQPLDSFLILNMLLLPAHLHGHSKKMNPGAWEETVATWEEMSANYYVRKCGSLNHEEFICKRASKWKNAQRYFKSATPTEGG